MNMKFIKSGEKKKIVKELNEMFGIGNLNYVLIETGKQKIRGFSGSMSREEIKELVDLVNVEIIGLYLIKKDRSYRLSLDATQVLGSQISKSVVDIPEDDFNRWIRGKDLNIKKKSGIWIVKYRDDLIGCGISNGEKIINHVPKERRVRKS